MRVFVGCFHGEEIHLDDDRDETAIKLIEHLESELLLLRAKCSTYTMDKIDRLNDQ